MSNLQTGTPFNFFIPATFEKSKDEVTGKTKLRIKGIASTSDEDSDEEVLEPSGFELSRLLKYGYFNYNHMAKNDPSAIVGEPDIAKIVGNKLYVEGDLYPESPLAQKIFSTAEMLEKSGSKRRFGFSIEGKSLSKDPLNEKRITKAMITGIAITPTPKNSNTLLSIVKGEYQEDYIEPELDPKDLENIIDVETTDGRQVVVDKNFNIDVKKKKDQVQKSISTESGAPVKKEDLEIGLKTLQKSEIDSLRILLEDSDLFSKCRKSLFEKGLVVVSKDSLALQSEVILSSYQNKLIEKPVFEKSITDLASFIDRKCDIELSSGEVYYGYYL